jgi:hypothetical protein
MSEDNGFKELTFYVTENEMRPCNTTILNSCSAAILEFFVGVTQSST